MKFKSVEMVDAFAAGGEQLLSAGGSIRFEFRRGKPTLGGPQIGGWTARQIHQAVLDTFDLSEKTYRLNQLRYDLRKLKGHGLIERDGSR